MGSNAVNLKPCIHVKNPLSGNSNVRVRTYMYINYWYVNLGAIMQRFSLYMVKHDVKMLGQFEIENNSEPS